MAAVTHFHVEDLTANSSTSSTYATFATISGASLTATNDYLIVARLMVAGNTTNRESFVRVSTADDTSIATRSEQRVEPRTTTLTNEGALYFFPHSFTTDGTPADILFQHKSEDGTAAVETDQITFFVLDLTDLGSSNYFETIHAIDSTEYGTSMADIFTIAGSDLGTDEWLILGYLRTDAGTTGGNYMVQVLTALDASTSSVHTYQEAEPEANAEQIMTGFALRHKALSGTPSVQVQASESDASDNHINGGGYAIALKT